MNCELIAVGSEILLGNILNTHAQFLSEMLANAGIPVYYHTAVGDNPDRLRAVAKLAFSRSDLVIFSGGLGPTTDDITAEAVADVLGLPLIPDERAWEEILSYFHMRGRTPTENNQKQCLVPKGADIFYNAHGTAPGFAVTVNGKTAVCLPGPPRELVPMVREQLMPYLMRESNLRFQSETLMVFGIGEPALELMLADLVTGTDPTVALYAKDGEVQVRVTGAVDRERPDDAKIRAVVDEIKRRTGICCYGQNIDSLEQAVVPLLAQQGKHLALAESLTGGMIGKRITSVPGSSKVFECGVISYSDRIKHELLGVREEDLARYSAVSAVVAKQMASGVQKLSGAEVAAAVTGFAGPASPEDTAPVGTVFVCVRNGDRQVTRELHLGHGHGDERDYIRRLTAMHALDLVRRMLLADPDLEYDEESL